MKMNARIYVMLADDGTIKLGHSKDPAKRSKQIGRRVDVVHTTEVLVQAEKIERLAHRVLALNGRHIKGEWFEASLDEAIAAIEVAIKQAEGQELALGGHLARPTAHSEMIHVRITADMSEQLRRISRSRLDTPSQAALIREALAAFIKREEGKT